MFFVQGRGPWRDYPSRGIQYQRCLVSDTLVLALVFDTQIDFINTNRYPVVSDIGVDTSESSERIFMSSTGGVQGVPAWLT